MKCAEYSTHCTRCLMLCTEYTAQNTVYIVYLVCRIQNIAHSVQILYTVQLCGEIEYTLYSCSMQNIQNTQYTLCALSCEIIPTARHAVSIPNIPIVFNLINIIKNSPPLLLTYSTVSVNPRHHEVSIILWDFCMLMSVICTWGTS